MNRFFITRFFQLQLLILEITLLFLEAFIYIYVNQEIMQCTVIKKNIHIVKQNYEFAFIKQKSTYHDIFINCVTYFNSLIGIEYIHITLINMYYIFLKNYVWVKLPIYILIYYNSIHMSLLLHMTK